MSSFLDLNHYDSFQESYFKIDDIITTQEKIVCYIDKPLIDLGYLDPSSGSKDLLPGTKLELPLWVAKFLAGHRKRLATVELPKQYGNSQRQILEADATVVDLQKLGPNYYRLGLQLMGFQFYENWDVSKSLMMTFQSRLRKIMDLSLNSSEDDSNTLKERLDQTEKLLFECGQKSTKEFSEWESRAVEKMSSSNMVVNLRKRKRWQMEEEDNIL